MGFLRVLSGYHQSSLGQALEELSPAGFQTHPIQPPHHRFRHLWWEAAAPPSALDLAGGNMLSAGPVSVAGPGEIVTLGAKLW